ncbi:hypothetical protein [Streptomyces sp. A1547]|uniref:hypothetical protein n=1 Tax=Streptomyces sp. A1547 TaxID=2563105 RepID=UPI0019D1ADAD|nr:hypothetical protein [Streptomyces sp. A1547]
MTAPVPPASPCPLTVRTPSRYLAAGDYWFDDEQADHHDGTNGRIHEPNTRDALLDLAR